MNMLFRPLGVWPRAETKSRRSAPFKATYQSTLVLLDRELLNLRAKSIVVQADVSEDDIRLDGMLRSDAKVKRPNIIIAADTKFGALQYLCDEFYHWQANVRAVALTLERLRLAELYGVTKRGEQYTGFRALPMGDTPPVGAATANDFFSSADSAVDWVDNEVAASMGISSPKRGSGVLLKDKEMLRSFIREAARIFHPDNLKTGNVEKFQKLQAAKELIEKAALV